tara:strand:- start:5714 stop:6601 length:888 start_codon:yes stop_codon:yes gene_type:complete
MSFGRKYGLTVGEAGKNGLFIEDLNIIFKIFKSDKVDDVNSGTANIKIFNLSKNSIDKIERDQAVILDIGYDSDNSPLKTVFFGQVMQVSNTKIGMNTETTIVCVDGYIPKREGFTSRKFEKGTSVGQIIKQIVQGDMNLTLATPNNGTLGASEGINKVYKSGSSSLGNSSELLTTICNSNFLTWIIRSGVVYVYAADGSIKAPIITISPTTGMIGSPERLVTSVNKLKDSKDLKQGYKVKALINGAIDIGSLLGVESEFIKKGSTFRVSKMVISGELEGADWTTEYSLLEDVKT